MTRRRVGATDTATQRPTRRWDAAGLTLLEVVAALVILGTTATALLVAQSRAVRQLSEARHRREASQVAEDLIMQWQLAGDRTDEPAEGTVATRQQRMASPAGLPERGWSWRRSVRRTRVDGDVELHEVTLVIYSEGFPPDGPLASVVWFEPVREESTR